MKITEQGFTLIELVLALTLSGLLMTALSGLLFSGFRSWTFGVEQMDTIGNMRIAMDRITTEIRNAVEISVPENPEEPADRIVMKVPTGGLNGSVNVQYRYDPVGKEIERNFQPVASKIKAMTVSFHDYPPEIKITISGIRKDGKIISIQSKATARVLKR